MKKRGTGGGWRGAIREYFSVFLFLV